MNDLVAIPADITVEAYFVEGYSRIPEVARRLDVSTRTINRWIHKGYFDGVIKNDPEAESGSYYLIPDSSIEAFIERRKSAVIKRGANSK